MDDITLMAKILKHYHITDVCGGGIYTHTHTHRARKENYTRNSLQSL